MTDADTTNKPRGFAAMDPTRQRELASRGGKAAHERGRANEFTPDTAREAGRKGGRIVGADLDYMRALGRKGGLARARRRQEADLVGPRVEPAPAAHG